MWKVLPKYKHKNTNIPCIKSHSTKLKRIFAVDILGLVKGAFSDGSPWIKRIAFAMLSSFESLIVFSNLFILSPPLPYYTFYYFILQKSIYEVYQNKNRRIMLLFFWQLLTYFPYRCKLKYTYTYTLCIIACFFTFFD